MSKNIQELIKKGQEALAVEVKFVYIKVEELADRVDIVIDQNEQALTNNNMMLNMLMDRHDEGREEFLEREKEWKERENEWKEREKEWKEAEKELKETEKELKERGKELKERDRKQRGNTLCIRSSFFSMFYVFNTCTQLTYMFTCRRTCGSMEGERTPWRSSAQ